MSLSANKKHTSYPDHNKLRPRSKLIKTGAKVVHHARQVIFQMAEVAVSRELFRAILEGIGQLKLPTPLPG